METLFLYAKEAAAYEEVYDYLKNRFEGYEIYFVYNPRNKICDAFLQGKNAFFYKEQKCMRHQGTGESERKSDGAVGIIPLASDSRAGSTRSTDIIRYEEKYRDAYIQMHSTDGYWDGEKMLQASDRFQIFLAVENGQLRGYIDVTKGAGVNEVFDLFVSEQARCRGYGKKLLKEAIACNGTDDFILTVDYDNIPALKCYDSVGFSDDTKNDLITAKMQV